MKTSLRVSGGVLAIVLGFGWLVYAWLDPSEPRYQGRRLNAWFKQYYRSGQFSRPFRGDEAKRAEASAALRVLGTNAVPLLLDECFAERHDSGFFTNVFMALSALPKPFQFPPFVPATFISHEAAEAIGDIRPPASFWLPRLSKALTSTDARQRRVALYLLGYVGDESEVVLPILVEKLHSQTAAECALAAQSLERLGTVAQPGLPALIEFVSGSGNKPGLINVCRALGNMGVAATSAVPVLKKRWEVEANSSRRLQLAAVICRIDVRETEVLNSILEELKDASHRQSAIRALGDIGANTKPAAPALLEAMAAEDLQVWHPAAGALLRIGETNNAMTGLSEKAKSNDASVKFNAASMILDLQPANGISQSNLLSLAEDSLWGNAALDRLARLGAAARPITPVLRQLATTTNQFSRQAAAALRQIESASDNGATATQSWMSRRVEEPGAD